MGFDVLEQLCNSGCRQKTIYIEMDQSGWNRAASRVECNQGILWFSC